MAQHQGLPFGDRQGLVPEERGVDEVCIIGGAEIYAQLLARTTRIYLTRVDADIAGDAVFPVIDSRDWTESKVSGCDKNAKNEYACEFFILDRKAPISAKQC